MKDDIQRDVAEWLRFVAMDQNTARHLFETMHPKPLEIICFHYGNRYCLVQSANRISRLCGRISADAIRTAV